MSTKIKIHERTDEMTDEMLRSEGHLEGGEAGPMNQLMSDNDYFDEMVDCAIEADSVTVGNDVRDDGAQEIAELFDGVTTVTDAELEEAATIIAKTEDVSGTVIDWLKDHKGDEVFTIHW